MPAVAILDRRQTLSERAFVELKVWELPTPIRGSVHHYKYRLVLILDDVCVLRYDNEAGKGDHKHLGPDEQPYAFVSLEDLLADFWSDVTARLE